MTEKETENISSLLDRYGDDLYRFAFILTVSDNGALSVLSDAFTDAAKDLSGDPENGKKTVLSYIYRRAAKCTVPRMTNEEMTKAYGEKYPDFHEFLSLPVKERAVLHLKLYEDMSDAEAEETVSGIYHSDSE